MTQISVIIPTLNEESNIRRALDSVFFADEIIVIDSFSTDATVAIVKEYDVRLLQRNFDDFSSQKNYAIKQASHDWILVIDADEEVTKELRESIQKAITTPLNFSGFKIHRKNFIKNKKLNYGGFTDKIIRLFKKEHGYYEGIVHEKVMITEKVGVLNGDLHHYTYKDYFQFKNKVEYYAELRAKELYDKGETVNLFHRYLKPVIRFCIHYFIKLGFLDGKNGFIFSYLMAYGVYKRFDKLKTLKQIKE